LEGGKQTSEYQVQILDEKIETSSKLPAKATPEGEALMNKSALADGDLARKQQVKCEQHDEIEKLRMV
jgi:hypothetical protein